MASVKMLTVLLLLFFATVEGGRKKSLDKIIIHVPYKIHKHHHTHTKYKIITIPALKKEHTVIYLKKQTQPEIKEITTLLPQSEISKTPIEVPEVMNPPHQQLTHSFTASINHLKIQDPNQTDQQQEHSIISADQQPFNKSIGLHFRGFVPDLTERPRHLSPHNNLIHNFPFKAVPHIPHPPSPSNFFVNPAEHHSFNSVLPKFTHQKIAHPQGHFSPPYITKALLDNPKALPDNVAHTSNKVYGTDMTGSKVTPYKVKEENQEVTPNHLVKHRKIPDPIAVPFLNSRKKGKTYVHLGHNPLTNANSLLLDNDYEYEHVGYLIIDGHSRKIVGKNFKELPLYSSALL